MAFYSMRFEPGDRILTTSTEYAANFIAYLQVADDNSRTVGRAVEVDLDVEFSQTTLEGFGGYRFFERAFEGSDLGIDFLFGARHTTLDMDIGLDTARDGPLFSQSNSVSKDREDDWFDAVIGARFESDYRNGWGSMLWLDLGEGSGSSSYQALAMVRYGMGNSGWKLYGGYRLLHLEFDTGSGDSRFGVDLDYQGPMLGAAYKF